MHNVMSLSYFQMCQLVVIACSIAEVQISIGAQYILHRQHLLAYPQGPLTLVMSEQRVGQVLSTILMLKSLHARPPDPLTNI